MVYTPPKSVGATIDNLGQADFSAQISLLAGRVTDLGVLVSGVAAAQAGQSANVAAILKILGGTQQPDPPVYRTIPAINPASGAAGSLFTAINGVADNATSYTRRWLLNGTVIGTGATITPAAGLLVREETATGPGGSVTAQSLPVTVSAIVIPPISISGSPPQVGQVGVPYSFTPVVANGSGSRTFVIASGVLLGGLSFNSATGAITGTPNVAGTISNLSIGVSDASGSASTTPVNVVIAAAAVVYTLDNTNADSTQQVSAVQGYSAGRDSYFASLFPQKGLTLPSTTGLTVSADADQLEALITNAEGANHVPAPTISFASGTASVNEGGTVANTINLNRDGLTGDVVVNLSTSGTATSGTDYTALPATVTVPAGQNSVSFNLVTLTDSAAESDETVVIAAALAAYLSATASKTVTIVNVAPSGTTVAPNTQVDSGSDSHRLSMVLSQSSIDGQYSVGSDAAGNNQYFVYVSGQFFQFYKKAAGSSSQFRTVQIPTRVAGDVIDVIYKKLSGTEATLDLQLNGSSYGVSTALEPIGGRYVNARIDNNSNPTSIKVYPA